MDYKKTLAAVKKLISLHFAEDPTPPGALVESKLSDGTVIKYSDLAAGGDIFIVADDGTDTPAPVGDLELEDGTLIVVTEAGKIAEVKAVETPPSTEDMNKKDLEVETQFAALKAENLALQARISALEKKEGAVGQVLVSMRDLVEHLCNSEDGEPITPPKQTAFGKVKEEKAAASAEKKKKMQEAYKSFAALASKKKG